MALSGKISINPSGWLALVLLAVILLLSPALLERKIRQASQKPLNLSRKSVR
jgi:hypothetical protein